MLPNTLSSATILLQMLMTVKKKNTACCIQFFIPSVVGLILTTSENLFLPRNVVVKTSSEIMNLNHLNFIL